MYGEDVAGWIALFGIACALWEVRKYLFLDDNDEEEK